MSRSQLTLKNMTCLLACIKMAFDLMVEKGKYKGNSIFLNTLQSKHLHEQVRFSCRISAAMSFKKQPYSYKIQHVYMKYFS